VTLRIMTVLILALILFLMTMFMSCSSEEATAQVRSPVVSSVFVLAKRLSAAEERIHNLEIQIQLLAEGERERAALLHGFETIGR